MMRMADFIIMIRIRTRKTTHVAMGISGQRRCEVNVGAGGRDDAMSLCMQRNAGCQKSELRYLNAFGEKVMDFARWCSEQPGPVAVGKTCNRNGIMGLAQRFCEEKGL